MVCNYATGACCRFFGLKGPTATLATGADSGLTALVLGADHLAWRDGLSHLLTAAVDEPSEMDDYDGAAASLLLQAGKSTAPFNLAGWALARDCEAAIAQALANACLSRAEVVPMVVSGPPASAGLRAVIAAIRVLKKGAQGPFLISSRDTGTAGAAIILQARSRRCDPN